MPHGEQGSAGERRREANPGSEPGMDPSENEDVRDDVANKADTGVLRAFVLEIGRTLSLAGTAVSETQNRLLRIATANGAGDARIAVFPTTLIVALGRAKRATVEVIPQLTGTLRLDQIAALYEVVKRAELGRVRPEDGLDELRGVRAMPPRFGPAITIVGYALMTVGLCLLLKPTPSDVAAAAGFGVLIGALALLSRGITH